MKIRYLFLGLTLIFLLSCNSDTDISGEFRVTTQHIDTYEIPSSVFLTNTECSEFSYENLMMNNEINNDKDTIDFTFQGEDGWVNYIQYTNIDQPEPDIFINLSDSNETLNIDFSSNKYRNIQNEFANDNLVLRIGQIVDVEELITKCYLEKISTNTVLAVYSYNNSVIFSILERK